MCFFQLKWYHKYEKNVLLLSYLHYCLGCIIEDLLFEENEAYIFDMVAKGYTPYHTINVIQLLIFNTLQPSPQQNTKIEQLYSSN